MLRGEGRSCREQFARGSLFSGGFHPGSDREPEDLGAGCGDGGGDRAAVFPRTSGSPLCRGGRAPSRGPGSRWVWRRGWPGQPYPHYWPTGSELESGSNRLFKLPECVLGEGSAQSWELFLTLRPLAAQALCPHAFPRPRGGVRRGGSGGHFLYVSGGEREKAT